MTMPARTTPDTWTTRMAERGTRIPAPTYDRGFAAPPFQDRVVLVNDQDTPIGAEDKNFAHIIGARHRAFSVFVLDTRGRLLLQRRAAQKYHSGGLWSNTCCGHPKPGEPPTTAAANRLVEEMGIHCELQHAGRVTYNLPVSNGLIEHENDHLFVGYSNRAPHPDAAEVSDWRWMDLSRLEWDLARDPARYTPWFGIAFAQALETIYARGIDA